MGFFFSGVVHFPIGGSPKVGERGVHHQPSIKNNELLAHFLHFSAVQSSDKEFLLSSMTNG